MSALLPPMSKIREYERFISLDVAQWLYDQELATVPVTKGMTLAEFLDQERFDPKAEYDTVY